MHDHFARQVPYAEVEHLGRIVVSHFRIREVHVPGDKIKPQAKRAILEGLSKHLPHEVVAVGHGVVEDHGSQHVIKRLVEAFRKKIMTQKARAGVLLGGKVHRFWNNIYPGIIEWGEFLGQAGIEIADAAAEIQNATVPQVAYLHQLEKAEALALGTHLDRLRCVAVLLKQATVVRDDHFLCLRAHDS